MGVRNREDEAMVGLYPVDKPRGCSSMDVVRVVRRAAGRVKTGHAGTLDPLASGLVICLLGRKATRLAEALMELAKVYETTVDLSAFTDSDDLESPVQPVKISQPPSEDAVRGALEELTGWIDQTPPAFSAVHVQGRRAYQFARRGDEIKMPVRRVRVDAIDVVSYDWPKLTIRVTCGKGTYIRSLARQIGQALGTGGHLTALRRTAVGEYTAEQAMPLDDITKIKPEDLLPLPPLR